VSQRQIDTRDISQSVHAEDAEHADGHGLGKQAPSGEAAMGQSRPLVLEQLSEQPGPHRASGKIALTPTSMRHRIHLWQGYDWFWKPSGGGLEAGPLLISIDTRGSATIHLRLEIPNGCKHAGIQPIHVRLLASAALNHLIEILRCGAAGARQERRPGRGDSVCLLNRPVKAQGARRRAQGASTTRREKASGSRMSHDSGTECVGLGGPSRDA
jgi:hypothetical protein